MIKIYTFHNHPRFIKLQKLLFSKFIEDDYEYCVVNTADSYSMQESIRSECESNQVTNIELPFLNTHGTPSACNSIPLQWIWDNYIAKESNISVIMDSDMFLLAPFNFTTFLEDNSIAGVINKRAHIWYPWNGLSFFAGFLPQKNTLNFREGTINSISLDVSGNLHHYLQKHPEVKVKAIYDSGFVCRKNENTHLLPEKLIERYEDSFLSQIFGQTFFHLRAGSNWNNSNNYDKKIDFLHYMVETALNDEITFPSTNGYRFIDVDDIRNIDAPTYWTEYTRFCNGKWINAKAPTTLKTILTKLIRKQ